MSKYVHIYCEGHCVLTQKWNSVIHGIIKGVKRRFGYKTLEATYWPHTDQVSYHPAVMTVISRRIYSLNRKPHYVHLGECHVPDMQTKLKRPGASCFPHYCPKIPNIENGG